MKADIEHLKLLSVFHYVLAGLAFLFSSFPLLYLFLGIMIVTGSLPGPAGPGPPGGPSPAVIGWIFIAFSASIILLGYAWAICLVVGGYCLARRKAWMFSCAVAGISCAWAPFGTLLGVFSLIVLLRPTVKDLYAGRIVEYDPDEEEEDRRFDPRDNDRPRSNRPLRDDGQYRSP